MTYVVDIDVKASPFPGNSRQVSTTHTQTQFFDKIILKEKKILLFSFFLLSFEEIKMFQ